MQNSFFLSLIVLSLGFNSLYAVRKCNPLYLNGAWLKKEKVSTPISAIATKSGFSLKNGQRSNLYFTKYFLKESGLDLSQLKNNLENLQLFTYRYHQPLTKISWFLPNSSKKIRSHRGGGRDHILNLDSALAIKGSGTNQLFSQSNHKHFDLKNFRRNGLMLLEDGLITYILAKQMKSLKMNVIDIPDLVIANEEIQSLVNQNSDKKNYIVQLHRNMSNARESMENSRQPKETYNHKREGIYQLASDMLLFNIAHGAINPENMGYGGQIMDLGHVSFGYPMLSYNYRCTLCRGFEGGSADGTLIGILDHYFGRNLYSSNISRSYSFNLKNTDINQILQKSIYRFKNQENNKNPIHVTRAQSKALRKLFKEEIKLWGNRDSTQFYGKSLTKNYQKIYSTKIEKSKPISFEEGDLGDLSPPENENNSDFVFPENDYGNIDIPQEQISQDQWINDNDFFTGEDHLLTFNNLEDEQNLTNNWDYMWPVNKAISYRFIWRVSAQKLYLSPSRYHLFKESIKEMLTPSSRNDFQIIVNLFEDLIKENQLKRKDFNIIFQEFMPSNLLKFHIDSMISENLSQTDITTRSMELINNLSKPIDFKPVNFRSFVESISRSLKKTKKKYLKEQKQKAIDRVNNGNIDPWDELDQGSNIFDGLNPSNSPNDSPQG